MDCQTARLPRRRKLGVTIYELDPIIMATNIMLASIMFSRARRIGYRVRPPSTTNMPPVQWALSSLHRNSIMRATSSGSP